MSTKTSFKRIALVAVAALGAGLLTVAPASATLTAASPIATTVTVTSSPDGATATPAAVGSIVTADLKLTPNATVAVDTTLTVTWKLVNPNGTDVTSDVTFSNASIGAGVVSSSFSGATATVTLDNVAAAAQKIGSMQFTAKTAGVYLVRFSSTASTAGDTANAISLKDVDNNPNIYVSGSGAVVAASGIGTTTIGAVTGGIAQVRFGTDAHTSSTVYNLTSSGVGTIQAVGAGALDVNARVGISATSDFTQGAKITTDADTTFNDVIATVASTVAGTQTLTWTRIDSATGAPTVVATQAITWGAAPALSTSNSKVYISAGNDNTDLAADDSSVVVSKTPASAGAIVANIQVTVKDGNDSALNGQKLTVTLDGPGLIVGETGSFNGTTTAGARTYSDSSANSGNTWQFGIAADGTAGKLTVTIASGTTVLATKSMIFYGAAAKYVATVGLIATANGSATTDAVVVCATDSAGNAVPGATIYASSGDSAVAAVAATGTTVSSAVTEDVDTGSAGTALVPTAYQAAKAVGCAGFAVTGASQTLKDSVVLTFRDANVAADATVSTTATVKVGSVKATSVVLSADKDSYAAGSKGTITLTFKDSVGRLVGAGAGTGTLDAVLTSSASLQGAALFATANNTYKGVATADVYFPWNAGTVIITGKTGTNSTYLDSTVQGLALSKSITVTAAADSTSAQIASLISKINALSKLIAKIQKKLGIK